MRRGHPGGSIEQCCAVCKASINRNEIRVEIRGFPSGSRRGLLTCTKMDPGATPVDLVGGQ